MAIDKYEDLPGIISELQDGGLQIFEENEAPATLVLGTASKGVSDRPIQVNRVQEFENQFAKAGTLMQGVYETLTGGSTNVWGMRVGSKSAILYGIGTDNMSTNPTSIETLLKDKDASTVYSVRYITPASRGPNEVVGQLIIKNIVDQIVFNNNPGGQLIDTGEVLVSGNFIGGVDIGDPADSEDFVSFEDIAKDKVSQEDIFAAADPAPASFTLSQTPNQGTVKVYLDDEEVAYADYSIVADELAFTTITDADNKEVKATYEYDDNASVNLRFGADGTELSRMELYEALEEAYRTLETEEYKHINVMGITLDAPNTEDGDLCVLSSDERIQVGQRFPVAGSNGDALGKLLVEEYDGEFFYFWDINDDGEADIFPAIGSASATSKINGDAIEADDFKEVNFAYQLANFCFVASSNEYNVLGSIGVSLPKSFAPKDVSRWIGKEPVFDSDGEIIQNGTGLLGNKLMVGRLDNKAGFYATDLGNYQGSGGATAGVLMDRGGRAIDIGRYLSVYVAPQQFFNPIDETGYGYHANGFAYYAGFVTTLPSQSAPTNKVARNASSPLKLSKAKLNSLAKYGFIALKHKNRSYRFSDAPTAARKDSDFRRLSTMRVIEECIDDIRKVATPFIGEPNTKASRDTLEASIRRVLGKKQELGVIQRFEVSVTATVKQRIEGDMTVELIIVPPYEVRKIEIITSLAKE